MTKSTKWGEISKGLPDYSYLSDPEYSSLKLIMAAFRQIVDSPNFRKIDGPKTDEQLWDSMRELIDGGFISVKLKVTKKKVLVKLKTLI